MRRKASLFVWCQKYIRRAASFIPVLTILKPKVNPASSASASKAPATPVPATTATPVPPAAPSHSSTTTSAVPSTPSPAGAGASSASETSTPFNDPSALTIGPQRAEAIANLESMGFPRSRIEIAMRAAFYNPDRAVEYLLNVHFPVHAEFLEMLNFSIGYSRRPSAWARTCRPIR